MYMFKTALEMTPEEIQLYTGVYAARRSRPAVAVLLVLTAAVAAAAKMRSPLLAAAAVFTFAMIFIYRLALRKIYGKKPPFAIGPYVSIELRDGFLHVNCSGKMKSYPPGYLEMDIKNGSYILTRKKDMVVIPRRVLNRLIVGELAKFFAQ